MTTAAEIKDRIEKANQFLCTIATRGRCFFAYKHDDGIVIARFMRQQNGSLWLLNEWKKEWMYVSRRNNDGTYKGFHHGGTLRSLITALVDWIRDGDLMLNPGAFNSHWAYPEQDLRVIINVGQDLGIILRPVDVSSTGIGE